jgi:ribosomal protein S18 acetylase RimI-like enzyme
MPPIEPLALRPLAISDLPAYKALRDEVVAEHEEAFTSDAAAEAQRSIDSYRARLGGAPGIGTFTIGAWRGDRLVGAITCEHDARHKVRHLGHIIGMMVHSETQKQGIGRALLDAALAQARGSGLEQLTLSVTSTNEVALRLYRRAGFATYGHLPRAIRWDGRYLDKDLMLLSLQ